MPEYLCYNYRKREREKIAYFHVACLSFTILAFSFYLKYVQVLLAYINV